MARGDIVVRELVSGTAEPALLEQLHDAVARLWQAAPAVPDGDRLRFETALAEVASNTVRHAVSSSEQPVQVQVELVVTPTTLEGELTDDGADLPVDLDPTMPADTATGGRGLLLIQHTVDSFTYARHAQHNRWHLSRTYA